MVKQMELENCITLTEISMTEIGLMTSQTGKEHIHMRMERSMSESGKKINSMEKGMKPGLTVHHTKVST